MHPREEDKEDPQMEEDYVQRHPQAEVRAATEGETELTNSASSWPYIRFILADTWESQGDSLRYRGWLAITAR